MGNKKKKKQRVKKKTASFTTPRYTDFYTGHAAPAATNGTRKRRSFSTSCRKCPWLGAQASVKTTTAAIDPAHPVLEMSRFAPLRSRCTMFLSCMYATCFWPGEGMHTQAVFHSLFFEFLQIS